MNPCLAKNGSAFGESRYWAYTGDTTRGVVAPASIRMLTLQSVAPLLPPRIRGVDDPDPDVATSPVGFAIPAPPPPQGPRRERERGAFAGANPRAIVTSRDSFETKARSNEQAQRAPLL
jgi:hypothetical protein